MRWILLLLCSIPQDEAIEAQVRRLGDESPVVRDKAERELVELGEPALPRLRKALEDADREVRIRARKIIHRIEWAPAINPLVFTRYPELQPIFDEGDPRQFLDTWRLTPIWNTDLGENLEAYLIGLLGHPMTDIRKRATTILLETTGRIPIHSRRPMRNVFAQIAQWSSTVDEEQSWLKDLAELAFRLCSSADREQLANAHAATSEGEKVLHLLRASIGDKTVEHELLESLESGPDWIRRLAIRGAARIHLLTARYALLRSLKNPSLGGVALEAFAEVADPSCRDEFLDFVVKTPPKQRGYLHFSILAKVGAREASGLLLEALAVPEQRLAAAQALADLGVGEAFDPICAVVSDKHNGYRIADCAARLTDSDRVDSLLKALEPNYPGQTTSLWGALNSIRDPGARRTVLERLRKEDRPQVRNWMFMVLPLGRSPEGRAILEETAHRQGDPLAFEAAMALLHAKGPDALPLVEEALRKTESPGWTHIRFLENYPTDRLVAPMARLTNKSDTGFAAVGYLEALTTPRAREELLRVASEAKDANLRHAAAGALAWVGGDATTLLARALAEQAENPQYSAPERFEDLLETDSPGVREELRRQVKSKGVRPFLSLLCRWGHPEMEGQLQQLLAEARSTRKQRIASEDRPGGFCSTGDVGDASGWQGVQAVRALAATGDRGLIPFFVELLRDPEPSLQSTAIQTLGLWRVSEAAPALRQLVLSGSYFTRIEAVGALAQIAAPGTAEFLKEHLRDTPDAAAHALARLGADARAEVLPLLAEQYDDCRLLGALDLMTNLKIYSKIDESLPHHASRRVAELPALLKMVTGVPGRLSAGVSEALSGEDLIWYDQKARTLRAALDMMGYYVGHGHPRLCHVYRNGAIEICTTDEARAYWRGQVK
jgi:HEAT repeat protein